MFLNIWRGSGNGPVSGTVTKNACTSISWTSFINDRFISTSPLMLPHADDGACCFIWKCRPLSRQCTLHGPKCFWKQNHFSLEVRRSRAGFPAYVPGSKISFVTTEPAPITAPSQIRTSKVMRGMQIKTES
jgi:hypothetical protein